MNPIRRYSGPFSSQTLGPEPISESQGNCGVNGGGRDMIFRNGANARHVVFEFRSRALAFSWFGKSLSPGEIVRLGCNVPNNGTPIEQYRWMALSGDQLDGYPLPRNGTNLSPEDALMIVETPSFDFLFNWDMCSPIDVTLQWDNGPTQGIRIDPGSHGPYAPKSVKSVNVLSATWVLPIPFSANWNFVSIDRPEFHDESFRAMTSEVVDAIRSNSKETSAQLTGSCWLTSGTTRNCFDDMTPENCKLAGDACGCFYQFVPGGTCPA